MTPSKPTCGILHGSNSRDCTEKAGNGLEMNLNQGAVLEGLGPARRRIGKVIPASKRNIGIQTEQLLTVHNI